MRNLKAKEIKSGYIWSKNGFTVFWACGYVLSYYGGSEKYNTMGELKESMKNH